MIVNFIDLRSRPYRWSSVLAVVEAAAKDLGLDVIGEKVTDQQVINQPIARIYPRGGQVEYFDTVAGSFKPLP